MALAWLIQGDQCHLRIDNKIIAIITKKIDRLNMYLSLQV